MIETSRPSDSFGEPALPSAAAPVRHWKDKGIYKAKILAQSLVLDHKNVLTLELKTELIGELMDRFDASSSVLPCQAGSPVIRLQFSDDNPTRTDIATRDLMTLGYEGDDLEALNPDSGKNHYNLVGKEVFLAADYRMYNDTERLFWNLRDVKPREDKKVPKGEAKKSAASAAYRSSVLRVKERQAERKNNSVPF